MAPEFKNSGATFSTTLRMFKECTCFETRVEDGLSDSRKAACRRSGGSLHKSRAWQKTYAPARTSSLVLSLNCVKKTVPRAGPEMYFS